MIDTMHPDAAPYRIPAPWSFTYDVAVPALLTVGDYLTLAGHACGRLADRLAPMGESDDPIRVKGRAR